MKRYREVKLDCDESAESYIAELRKAEMGELEDEEPDNKVEEPVVKEDEGLEKPVSESDGELVFSSVTELDD